jgi:hypothetical protein
MLFLVKDLANRLLFPLIISFWEIGSNFFFIGTLVQLACNVRQAARTAGANRVAVK